MGEAGGVLFPRRWRSPATPLLPGTTLASFFYLTGVLCGSAGDPRGSSTINSEALINSLTMGW